MLALDILYRDSRKVIQIGQSQSAIQNLSAVRPCCSSRFFFLKLKQHNHGLAHNFTLKFSYCSSTTSLQNFPSALPFYTKFVMAITHHFTLKNYCSRSPFYTKNLLMFAHHFSQKFSCCSSIILQQDQSSTIMHSLIISH